MKRASRHSTVDGERTDIAEGWHSIVKRWSTARTARSNVAMDTNDGMSARASPVCRQPSVDPIVHAGNEITAETADSRSRSGAQQRMFDGITYHNLQTWREVRH